MANTSRINGFRPLKHVMGAHIQARRYFIPSSDGSGAIFLGDVVKLGGSADSGQASSDGGAPTCTLAAAGDAVIGVVVGFAVDPTNLNVSGQFRAASTARYCYVIDDPYVIFEAQASGGTPAVGDVGLNVNHAVGSGSTTTAQSGATLDWGTPPGTGASLTFKIMAFSQRVDNDDTAANSKIQVMINNHQLRGTGILGVS